MEERELRLPTVNPVLLTVPEPSSNHITARISKRSSSLITVARDISRLPMLLTVMPPISLPRQGRVILRHPLPMLRPRELAQAPVM